MSGVRKLKKKNRSLCRDCVESCFLDKEKTRCSDFLERRKWRIMR